MNNKTWINN